MLWKSYLARSAGYVAIFNTGMLVFLSLSSLEKYGIDIDMKVWGLPLVIGAIGLAIFIGYLEDVFGFWREETVVAQKRNPYLMEIHEDVKQLRKDVEALKQDNN